MAAGVDGCDGGNEAEELSLKVPLGAIPVREIGRILGYADTSMPEHFSESIAKIIGALEERCTVCAGYRVVSVNRSEGRNSAIDVGGKLFTPGRIIVSQLQNARQAALFVCTIGSRMEEMAAECFAGGDPVTGHFIDTVASVAVERVADSLLDTIERQMRERGLAVTNRFSPGYCGWPLSQQQELFSFFPDGFCGVLLTESALMLPKKSVSGIIGIGPDVTREPYFCDRCNDTGCTYKQFLNSRKHTKDDQHD